MDKYEFSLKIEQMKKLIHEEDYYTALRIVEGIDWNRVRNTNLLTMAASVYEKNDRLNEARRILEQALERSPVGKRIIYKLAEIAVRSGDIKAAEEYYYEYRQVDPEDYNIYLLQYMILKAGHAPYDRQLQPLELYCEKETDEQWLYELATAYDSAGRRDDCVRTCDKISLMFGDSPHAIKALKLKMKYATLTDQQRNVLYPRSTQDEVMRRGNAVYSQASGYERGYAQTDYSRDDYQGGGYREDAYSGGNYARETYSGRRDPYTEYGITDAPDPEESPVLKQEPVMEYDDTAEKEAEAKRNSDALAAIRYEGEDDEFEAYIKARENSLRKAPESGIPAAAPGGSMQPENQPAPAPAEEPLSEEPAEAAKEAGIPGVLSESPAEPLAPDEGVQMKFDFGEGGGEAEEAVTAPEPAESLTIEEEVKKPGPRIIQDDPFADIRPAKAPVGGLSAEEEYKLNGPDASYFEVPAAQKAPGAGEVAAAMARPPVPEEPVGQTLSMIVEAGTVADGLTIAVDELKRIHRQQGLQHASSKTSAEKLNRIGLTDAIIRKIQGRDFVIENAGSLDRDIIEGLYKFISTDRSGTIVVMVDTPAGMDAIEAVKPELFDICDYISDVEDEEGEDSSYDDVFDDGFDDSDDDAYEEHFKPAEKTAYEEEDAEEERPRRRSEAPARETFNNVKRIEPAGSDDEMEIDDFAQYCAQYAADIDCSITGTSMLALYERIELMEEDGIKLTRENAEALIEEAADRAEKPPLGKRITGVFHSKYDKNGCLILKESDFIY